MRQRGEGKLLFNLCERDIRCWQKPGHSGDCADLFGEPLTPIASLPAPAAPHTDSPTEPAK